ncbi:MAG: DUF3369 domain-containing protein [Magnetococcales bacterium]|nr:DUF3369 domain-containing protein [Magnetococcales bacterium]NGZ27629.1 DUF3369 domain-containing protein [Magnetococcales bacterium]
MRIVRNKGETKAAALDHKRPWKLLVVDDEPGVHALTSLNLADLVFQERPLQLISAYSKSEAMGVLEQHPDIAVALVDVVMETVDAGLNLVDHIRNTMKNKNIRLIIRTGQPGSAPERLVIDRYDIDDYKEKTELTAQKLYTVVRSALKSYQDLCSIECTNKGLSQLLNGAPELLRISTLQQFFQGVMAQILSLLELSAQNFQTTQPFQPHVLVATREKKDTGSWIYRGGCGHYGQSDETTQAKISFCQDFHVANKASLINDAFFPLIMQGQIIGGILVENGTALTEHDRQFLHLLSNQCVTALENYWLYDDLESANQELTRLNSQLADANEQTSFMLAVASEFKDQETGNHINRIVNYTEELAIQLPVARDLAQSYARASMLHDLGKMGIPDAILQKPGKLTKEEFELIKNHPRMGMEILSKNEWFELARQIAFCHHEKWDGSGYPQGLSGEAIPLPARIVAVADVFDALTSRRPYKEPWPVEEAVEEIRRGSGSHFDPKVVDAFIALYENGSLQRILSTY